MSDGTLRGRMKAAAAILFLALAALAGRLAALQVGGSPAARETLAKTRQFQTKIPAGRGAICDQAGLKSVLAMDVACVDVCVDPAFVITNRQVQLVAAGLAGPLAMPREAIAASILNSPTSQFVRVKRYVEPEVAAAVRRQKLKGVICQPAPLRVYPLQSSMCQVVGFVNREGRGGSAGVEFLRDADLRGIPGVVEGETDARRREIRWRRTVDIRPVPGSSVCLTLDRNLQQMAETTLDEVMAEHHPRGACLIVERVASGEILAMASRPGYDPNRFYAADTNALLNRAIGVNYEPGSTFKVIAFAAALNEGKVTPDTVFPCGEGGAWVYKGRALHDYHPNPPLTVADGVKKSSNILTAQVALLLGEPLFYRYLQAFRIGMRTGIDLPGEECGLLSPPSRWSSQSITRIPIGQGVAVTALQMLNVFCAIANDGRLMQPYVVQRIVGHDGTVLQQAQPVELGRPIRPETAATMRRLLTRVTEEGGTGKRARLDGYTIAGKTGSAQKAEHGGYSATDYVASFVGFLPADKPEIGVIVVVDTPQPLHTGGVVAAPAFARLASQAVRYLDIPPEEPVARAGL